MRAIIGSNCKRFQNVTIRVRWPEGSKIDGVPRVGDNVQIECGAVIIGNITIGNNVYIGANTVVLNDVFDSSIAIGIPAKIRTRK